MILFSFGGADRHFCPVKRLLKPFKHFRLFQQLKKRSKNLSANHLSRQFNADYNRKANSCGQHDQLIHPQPELWFGHLLRALSVQKKNKKKNTKEVTPHAGGTTAAAQRVLTAVFTCMAPFGG